MENNSIKKTFLIDYIYSLSERTQVRRDRSVYGIDWVIYNLYLSKGFTPIRLPFFRNPQRKTPKIKTETEFGIDLAFLSRNKKELIIFVLKDEELNNKNWTRERFHDDLVKASSPDLSLNELSHLECVYIVLCYNKDDNDDGVRLYQRFVDNQPINIQKNITVQYERWNLTKLVDEVEHELFNPSLLPQNLASLLTYITGQFSDFKYGTKEWVDQLLPNFKNFLKLALDEPLDERKLKLVPVVLYILKKYKNSHPSSDTGWIDLVEWAMLYLWDTAIKSKKDEYINIVFNLWVKLYLSEILFYLGKNEKVFYTEHSFSSVRGIANLSGINDAYLAYWNIARLGICTLGIIEAVDHFKEEGKEYVVKILSYNADLLISCFKANPSIFRPLIDLNHIELFLIWLILYNIGDKEQIYEWLGELENRLLTRRVGHSNIPFIESRNRLDLVAEYAATNERPDNFTESSSYLLLMLMELCFSLDDNERDELLDRYLTRVVLGKGSDGEKLVKSEVELMGWMPSKNWHERILVEKVTDGVAITTNNFIELTEDDKPLSEKIREFVQSSRDKFPFKFPSGIPLSLLILACLKNKSPLPAEFWRRMIFPIKPRKGK